MTPKAKNSILAFLAGILLAMALTLLLTFGGGYESWAYHYFQGDYLKVGWVYDSMITRVRPTENLFMGSSHTYNGIDDRQIAQALGGPQTAYNAAIPTSGRDLEYVVLRDILEKNKPKRIFIEVRETEERTGHFGFPILAGLGDVVTAPPSPWWPKNLLYALQYRFEYLIYAIPAFRRDEPTYMAAPAFGYVANPHQVPMPQLISQARDMKANKKWRMLPGAFGDLEFSASETYLRRLASLCQAKGVELHFLYMPFVGASAEPAQAGFYRSIGTLHGLPDFIRNDPRYWADITHFNPLGAKTYSRWLADNVLRSRNGVN